MAFKFGIESLLASPPKWLKTDRVGLVCHPASVDQSLDHSADLLRNAIGTRLIALFGPQHGARGDKQDNMIESDDYVDPISHIPVYSLYGEVRSPSDAMLANIETLIVDLQDVGTRIYTFASTMAACIRSASQKNIRIVVTDRPNPIGGLEVEGNILRGDCRSFVGEFSIPMRHGMTMGELARFLVHSERLECDLEVSCMRGWERKLYWDDLDLEWIAPSPNVPSVLSAIAYPGTVLFEATNVSEGRGTTRPFELIGAPFIDGNRFGSAMNGINLPGVHFRPTWFEPTFHKWRGQLCGGVQLHIRDRESFRPYVTGLMMLETIRSLWPDDFRFIDPPYEYEMERQPIDLIVGSRDLMRDLQSVRRGVVQQWERELESFMVDRQECLLYQ